MDKDEGKLSDCAASGCGWRCCEFQQGNYIVLHPGELDAARAVGQSIAHLEITDADYYGGQKAVCKATVTATCDGGFKPLDCASYPFFPAPPAGKGVDLLIKGKKCPLQVEHLQGHAALVRRAWNEVMARSPKVRAWLAKVRLVGYSEPMRALPRRHIGEPKAAA